MKTNELMLGDWVLLEGTPAKIRGVEIYCSKLYVKTNLTDAWCMSKFEPIPLTPEILEKNGFNDTTFAAGKRVRLVVLCKEYQINYYFNSNWLSIYKNAEVNGSDYPVFICAFQERIKYVHELQHALRLCKVDKEIVP